MTLYVQTPPNQILKSVHTFKVVALDFPQYLDFFLQHTKAIKENVSFQSNVITFLSREDFSSLYKNPEIQMKISTILKRANLLNYVDTSGSEDIFSLKSTSHLLELMNRMPFDASQSSVTPLHIAAFRGDLEALKKHLSEDIDPNAVTLRGKTALHLACVKGQFAIVKFLLEKKAKYNINPHACTPQGFTPFHYAYSNFRVSIVKLYLQTESILDLFVGKFYFENRSSYDEINQTILQFLVEPLDIDPKNAQLFFRKFTEDLLIAEKTNPLQSNYSSYCEKLKQHTDYFLTKNNQFKLIMEGILEKHQTEIPHAEDIDVLNQHEKEINAWIDCLSKTEIFHPRFNLSMQDTCSQLQGYLLNWKLLQVMLQERKEKIRTRNQSSDLALKEEVC